VWATDRDDEQGGSDREDEYASNSYPKATPDVVVVIAVLI
jgi:hypothetical protein